MDKQMFWFRWNRGRCLLVAPNEVWPKPAVCCAGAAVAGVANEKFAPKLAIKIYIFDKTHNQIEKFRGKNYVAHVLLVYLFQMH